MRYELTEHEWTAIRPMLPNKPRGVTRVNDGKNSIFLGRLHHWSDRTPFDQSMRRPVGEMMTEAVGRVEPATPLTRVLPS